MSSVPRWKQRDVSDVDYLFRILRMSEEIGRLVHRTAKKYRSTYGDKLISLAADAMTEGKIIYHTYAKTDDEISRKIDTIVRCRSIIESICTTMYVWINILVSNDGMDSRTMDKLYAIEYRIGTNADDALDSLEKTYWSLVHMYSSEYKQRLHN